MVVCSLIASRRRFGVELRCQRLEPCALHLAEAPWNQNAWLVWIKPISMGCSVVSQTTRRAYIFKG